MRFLFNLFNRSRKLSEAEKKDIEFVKNTLITEIKKVQKNSDKLKERLDDETLMSVIHLNFFSAWLQQKKFKTLKEVWDFLNKDEKGIIQKIFYVGNYLLRIEESMKVQRAPGEKPSK